MTPELIKLVCKVDLSTEEKIIKFKEWQHNDGSVEGIKKLLEEQKNDEQLKQNIIDLNDMIEKLK